MTLQSSYAPTLIKRFQAKPYSIPSKTAYILGVGLSTVANYGGEKSYGKTIGILLCLKAQGIIADHDYDELSGLALRLLNTHPSGSARAELEAWLKDN